MCDGCNNSVQFGDPSAGHFTQSNSSMSGSGSIAESGRFDGPSASDEHYEGQASQDGGNKNIGYTGSGN
jgi:hypothetical protein